MMPQGCAILKVECSERRVMMLHDATRAKHCTFAWPGGYPMRVAYISSEKRSGGNTSVTGRKYA